MPSDLTQIACTAFLGERAIASGTLTHVVSTVKDALDDPYLSQVLIFDDAASQQLEIDFRGTKAAVLQRLSQHPDTGPAVSRAGPPRVGRPKLGVVAGEVTLLPRHWEWLKSQPGGASVTLRKLVDEARHVREKQDTRRQAQEATYRFMTVMAGDFPHYEDALRALYKGDSARFYHLIRDWAPDIRDHIEELSAKIF
ncbi:MAG: DUF2239 family protein [Sulfobacillus sp.]